MDKNEIYLDAHQERYMMAKEDPKVSYEQRNAHGYDGLMREKKYNTKLAKFKRACDILDCEGTKRRRLSSMDGYEEDGYGYMFMNT